MERLDVASAPEQYTFPNYADGDLDQVQDKWNQPVDSIILPQNFFDYTTRGDIDRLL